MSTSPIIEKIRAALRKADPEQNPNEAERDVAMRAAQRLMLKHDIEMGEIGDLNPDSGRDFENQGFGWFDGDEKWKGMFLTTLGRLYHCEVFCERANTSTWEGHWRIFGRKDHVEATEEMFKFLTPQLQGEFDILASKMSKQQQYARKYGEEAKRESLGYGRSDDNWLQGPVWNAMRTSFSDEDFAQAGYDRLLLCGGDPIEDIIKLCSNGEQLSYNYCKKIRPYVKKQDISPARVDHMGVYRDSFFLGAITKIDQRLKAMLKEDLEDLGETGTQLITNEEAALERAKREADLHIERKSSETSLDEKGAIAGQGAGSRADLSGHNKVSTTRRVIGN